MRTRKEIKADLNEAARQIDHYRRLMDCRTADEGLQKWEPIYESLSQEFRNHPETVAACNRKNAARRERHAVATSLGLKRVKGALGGTYYE